MGRSFPERANVCAPFAMPSCPYRTSTSIAERNITSNHSKSGLGCRVQPRRALSGVKVLADHVLCKLALAHLIKRSQPLSAHGAYKPSRRKAKPPKLHFKILLKPIGGFIQHRRPYSFPWLQSSGFRCWIAPDRSNSDKPRPQSNFASPWVLEWRIKFIRVHTCAAGQNRSSMLARTPAMP